MKKTKNIEESNPAHAGSIVKPLIMLTRILGVLACITFAAPTSAQKYPDKVITIIVPFTAGGPTDTVARLIAQPMTKVLKQQIIIENVGGAGGTIGAARVARSAPDGYTLFLHNIGHSTAPSLYRKLPYDTIKDFEPIGIINEVPMTVIARRDFPPSDVRELVTYLRQNKDKVTYANAGIGAASHLCGMLLMSTLQVDLTTVPYKGTADVMKDLLGSQIDFSCDQTTNTTSQIKAGKVKVYGVTTLNRVPSLAKIPTIDEAGIKGFEVSVWHGLYAPKNTPKAVLDAVTKALQVALKDETVKQRFADLGTEPMAENRATPDALRAHLKSEIDKWAPIIKKAGVYAD
jgi:tripartite-type tricarboxylate transporter receptor subunit TctC